MKKLILIGVACAALGAFTQVQPARAQDTYDRATITNVAGTVDFTFTNSANAVFTTFFADSLLLGFTANTGTTFAVDYKAGPLWVSNAVTRLGVPARLLTLTNLPPFFIGDVLRVRASDTNSTASKLNYRKTP